MSLEYLANNRRAFSENVDANQGQKEYRQPARRRPKNQNDYLTDKGTRFGETASCAESTAAQTRLIPISDRERLRQILTRHSLLERWAKFEQRFLES